MRIIVTLLLCVLAAGCQRSAMVSITAEAAPGIDPAADLSQYHTLAVSTETDPANRQAYLSDQVARAITDDLLAGGYYPALPASQKPLASADPDTREELAHLARNAFATRGLGFNPADPQLLLTIDDLGGPYRYIVPLREIRITNDASPLDDGSAILADQRFAILPVRALSLALYDARKPDPRKPLWRATAVCLHNSESLRTLAPYLLRAMLDEFPTPSGKPLQREIPLDPRK